MARAAFVRRLRAIALVIAAATAAWPTVAAEPVDVALVLAVDSSGSIDEEEFRLQREGYARALMHPDVLKRVRRGAYGAIAVTFVEWSGPRINSRVLDWTRIAGAKDAAGAAARILAAPRTIFGGGTALGGAIALGMTLLDGSPYTGTRRVIDISGDGWNNRGPWPTPARDAAVARGVTINGLAILDFDDTLVEHFRDEVIGGPGAFVIAANGFDDFARAVLKKLLQELNLARRLDG